MKIVRLVLLIHFLVVICLCRDIIETKAGNIHRGKLVEVSVDHIAFVPEGSDIEQNIPKDKIERVILADGTVAFGKADSTINIRIEQNENRHPVSVYEEKSEIAIESKDHQFFESSPTLDSLNAIFIYRHAYQTAMRDRKIDSGERAILKSLKRTMGMAAEDILYIHNQINLATPKLLDQSGRWPLVLQNIAWGAGLYGWAIPIVLGADDFKWVIGSEMMSFAGAFYLTYEYTKKMEIPHSRAQMMRLGSAVGFHYGWSINDLFGVWDWGDEKPPLVVLMASIPVGIYVGDVLYNRWNPSHGQSWSLTLWSGIGLQTISEIQRIFDPRPEEPEMGAYYDFYYNEWVEPNQAEHEQWEKDIKRWKKRRAVVDVISYPLGMYAGYRFFGDKQYTFGDALMLYQGWGFGLIYSLMLMDVVGVDFENELYRLGIIGGGIGGTLLYDRYIDSYDYTFGQSVLMLLGTGSGMAFSVGTSAILELDEASLIQVLVMGGGVAGFFLTNSILSVSNEIDDYSDCKAPDITVSPTFLMCKRPGGKLCNSLVPGISIGINF